MRDVHVHFLHGNPIGYHIDFFEGFIKAAQTAGLDEIYLLEHTHQFIEFERVYKPIKSYNDFQNEWITKRMIMCRSKLLPMHTNKAMSAQISWNLKIC